MAKVSNVFKNKYFIMYKLLYSLIQTLIKNKNIENFRLKSNVLKRYNAKIGLLIIQITKNTYFI